MSIGLSLLVCSTIARYNPGILQTVIDNAPTSLFDNLTDAVNRAFDIRSRVAGIMCIIISLDDTQIVSMDQDLGLPIDTPILITGKHTVDGFFTRPVSVRGILYTQISNTPYNKSVKVIGTVSYHSKLVHANHNPLTIGKIFGDVILAFDYAIKSKSTIYIMIDYDVILTND